MEKSSISRKEMEATKLKKAAGWVLIYLPLALRIVCTHLPYAVNVVILKTLLVIGTMSISFAGVCLIQNKKNKMPIIIKKDEQEARKR